MTTGRPKDPNSKRGKAEQLVEAENQKRREECGLHRKTEPEFLPSRAKAQRPLMTKMQAQLAMERLIRQLASLGFQVRNKVADPAIDLALQNMSDEGEIASIEPKPDDLEITDEMYAILNHTMNRAAGRLYCGDSPEMQRLCKMKLMHPAGYKAGVPSPYFVITAKGMKELRNRGRNKKCKHCGGLIEDRNPTGNCDHLQWPEYLSDEAKIKNGYTLEMKMKWEKKDDV